MIAEIWQHYIWMPVGEWFTYHQPDAIGKEEEEVFSLFFYIGIIMDSIHYSGNIPFFQIQVQVCR